jgi:MFS family permease
MTRATPLWLLVALQGVVSAASLVVEIVAGRMLAPHVGMSLYTWTAVIAVVLAGFSVGHWWGGRLAGKPVAAALTWTGGALLAAAVTTSGAVFVLPAVAGPVLTSVTDPVWAITALTALAFFLPSFFAGVPAPVLAQIAVTTREPSGPALGAMFASGAVGAIAGTLLAGFVFIAWLGSILTLAVVTLVYVASGLLCFWLARSRGLLLAVLAGIAATGLAGFALSAPPQCQVESRYFCLRRRSGARGIAQFQRMSTSASTSALVLYMPKDARQVAVTPRCSISGPAQCWPARTATPFLSSTVEMSCACAAPSIVKEKIAPLTPMSCPARSASSAREPRARIVAQPRSCAAMASIPDAHHVVERHAKADHLHDAGRAGLELHRRVVVGHVSVSPRGSCRRRR